MRIRFSTKYPDPRGALIVMPQDGPMPAESVRTVTRSALVRDGIHGLCCTCQTEGPVARSHESLDEIDDHREMGGGDEILYVMAYHEFIGAPCKGIDTTPQMVFRAEE